ncbi:MAG: RsmE family RNA methyltransferase [Actinomycetota bacterium]
MAGSPDDALLRLRDRPFVFVDDLDHPELDDADRHHLERSLRLRPGAAITIADGAGRWRPARLGLALSVDGEIETEGRPGPPLTVGFAPVKGDRSDLVVQKLTELGVDEIVPLLSIRSVVRWEGDRAAKQLARHRRIVREAAMQSRNPWLPIVHPQTPLPAFLDAGAGTVVADPAGPPLAGPVRRIAVGPEGGFASEEVDGRTLVGLPGRILRTETAAIAAAVLAVSARS